MRTVLNAFFLATVGTGLFADTGNTEMELNDYYIIEVNRGYSVVERYSGPLFEMDKVVGDLSSYGFKDLYNLSRSSEIRVFVEDFWLDEEEAFEQLYELGG